MNVLIKTPTVQSIKKLGIAYEMTGTTIKPIMSRDFKARAMRWPLLSQEEYWSSIEKRKMKPIYGSNVEQSLFDVDCEGCNFLDLGADDISHKVPSIPGVNTSFLYFGMAGSSFAWHVEDHDMFSISFLHEGAPKTWYSVPNYNAKQLEELLSGIYVCPRYLQHKTTLIDPRRLRMNGVPAYETTQYVNEIIITFPHGYHAGFNHGYNCAEAKNFVTREWIPFGVHSKMSARKCCPPPFTLNMDRYVKQYYPGNKDFEDFIIFIEINLKLSRYN